MTVPETGHSSRPLDPYNPPPPAIMPVELLPVALGLAFLGVWAMAGVILVRER